ncbi:NRDE-2, necessary for RNA interference-domain-containing protein [Globomyces pollinis-pini]|nr:NRDE-2, necessary for RNA interference-domain-containing protein [Globomyces pollinis-pini]
MDDQNLAPRETQLTDAKQFPSFSSFPTEIASKTSFPVFSSFPKQVLNDQKTIKAKVSKKESKKKSKKSKRERIDVEMEDGELLDYFIDRIGDTKNSIYHAIRDSTIPVYKRKHDLIDDGWKISGMSRHQLIIKQVNDSTSVKSRIRYREFKTLPDTKLIRLFSRNSENNVRDPLNINFIPIPDTELISNETQDFYHDLEFQKKCSECDKLIHEDPENVANWIKFLDLQDTLLATATKETRSSIQKRVYEKKLAIVEKALDSLPDSEKLLELYMTLLEESLDSKALLKKWDTVLMQYPDSFLLWKKYLDYRTSNPISFQLSSMLELFDECLDTLSKADKGPERDSNLIYIFTRLCEMLKQSGFIEKAIACFQALIEFNLFCPPDYSKRSFYDKLELFEVFWDSECPRFGDKDAKGWANSLSIMDTGVVSTIPNIDVSEFDDIEDDYKRWYVCETHIGFSQWLPVRGSVDENIDDPFQAVLFDDIRFFLFELTCKQQMQELISHFLSICGVSTLQTISSSSDFTQDAFIHGELLNEHILTSFLMPTELSVSFPFRFNPQQVDLLYGNERTWPSSFTSDDIKVMRLTHCNQIEVVLEILKQSFDKFQLTTYCLYLLWINYKLSPGLAEKMAKSLLKTLPMCLPLWNMYAQIVLNIKGVEKSRKIYQTTLAMFKSFPKEYQKDVDIIYKHLAILEWKAGNNEKSIQILVAYTELSSIDMEPVSPIQLLKAKKFYTSHIDICLTTMDSNPNDFDKSMETGLCIIYNGALLELLTHGLDSAITFYNEIISRVNAGTLLEELLHQNLVNLVCESLEIATSFKPSVLRNVLEKALDSFPYNTLFLTMFGWNEGRTKLDNRVRGFVNRHLASHPSQSLSTFAIWTELHQRSSPNASVIRSLLTDALNTHGKFSISLWCLAIEFEIQAKEQEKAKLLFYQAISNLPWCKNLYMMAFNRLRDVFTELELDSLLELMEEKELRISHSLK